MEFLLNKEIIGPIFVILLAIISCIISKIILKRIVKYGSKNLNDGKSKTIINLIKNIINCIIILIAIVIILEIYGIDTKSLVASLGVVGLVVGLALQDILKDFFVGISIIFEGQYKIGDWVTINNFSGEVLPSNLRTTKLKAYTGEVKIISNRNITEIINHSMEQNTLIVDIGVSYDMNIDKVKTTIDDICEQIKQEKKLKQINCLGVQTLDSSQILFRIVALIPFKIKYDLEREIKEKILRKFKDVKIEIPYKQVVVHNGK